jgi:hypothetical protein
MKFLFALMVFSNYAFAAGNLHDFTGKFKAGKGCGGDTGYGSLQYNKAKKLVGVSYSIYGSDPTGFGISLGKSVETNPNWPSNPIKTILYSGYWEGDDKLVADTTHIFGKDGLGGKAGEEKFANKESIELTKNGVLYKEYNKDGEVTSSCRLTRIEK